LPGRFLGFSSLESSLIMQSKLKTLALRAQVATLAAVPALSFAVDPTTAVEAIGTAKTDILAIVAAGGVAMIVIALAFVGWRVGTKFVRRLGNSG
jgi:hypothetical protein